MQFCTILYAENIISNNDRSRRHLATSLEKFKLHRYHKLVLRFFLCVRRDTKSGLFLYGSIMIRNLITVLF